MTSIDASTKVVGLFGNPVHHSLSPQLQNWTCRKKRLNYRYFAFRVLEDDLSQALRALPVLDIRGVNLTIPHKESAASLMDDLSDPATATGAVNTVLVGPEGSLYGHNTDVQGFLSSLSWHGVEVGEKPCLIFGAGGGASAVLFGLIKRGASRVTICNRTLERAENLVETMRETTGFENLCPLELGADKCSQAIRESAIVVNATPVGMYPDTDRTIWADRDSFSADQIVCDLVYNPVFSKFLHIAASAGATTINGLDMLLGQGLASLELWTGEELADDKTVSGLRNYLKGELK